MLSNNRYQFNPLLVLLLLGACGDDGSSAIDGGPGDKIDANTESCVLEGSGTADLQLAGHCPQESLLGTILLAAQQDFSFLDAKVANAVLPASVRAEEMSMGGCKLMRKSFPFCDPACTSEETCNLEGVCIPFPKRQDLGDICVAGLAIPYVLSADGPGYHYFNTQLDHPAVAGGERIEVRSTGGAYQALDLAGVGVSAMASTDEQWNIDGDTDLQIAWAVSALDAHASVRVSLNIDQHGSSPLLLACEFPDTGSATIPGVLIDALQNSGISGFPSGEITRETVDSAQVSDGCIEFVVSSPQTMKVRVANHTPCNAPNTCPSGQTCNLMTETCE